VIVQIVEWWACHSIEGNVVRTELLKSETEAFITSDLVHTEIVIPGHLLVEHRASWIVEVAAKAMYIAAATETPEDIVARLGFEWDEDKSKFFAPGGVIFSQEDCRWWPTWDLPMWDLTRCLRFKHLFGNAGGCLDIGIVAHCVNPKDGDELPLDLIAMHY